MSSSFIDIQKEFDLLVGGYHIDPHRFLGLQPAENGQKIIRVWAPHKDSVKIEYKGRFLPMTRQGSGLFTLMVEESTGPFDYQVNLIDDLLIFDPYNFELSFTLVDAHLLKKGVHYKLYEALGSHMISHEGIQGTKFAVFAPNAKQVSLITDIFDWDERIFPMRRVPVAGVWEIFIPDLPVGTSYKYAIKTAAGEILHKSDPFASQFEMRPKNASVTVDKKSFCWRDREWLEKREKDNYVNSPMNIYEVHLGSWMKKRGGFLGYREIASELVRYVKEMGYTHVEILPITEHPLDESWGYQVTGYFAPTSRYGTFQDFQYFVNHLHMHKIGVILDWAPGHFPSDEHGLSCFDGTSLFEKDDPVMGWHPEWDTHIFDYGKKEVTNFLISSALFWIEEMHIDAIRVDAVESMIHLDYARSDDAWTPNHHGTNENLDAIEFIKHLNSIIHLKHPSVLTIAEDASIYEGVTRPLEWGGLGFDLKWNLGWMNDTLSFIQKDPIFRKYHHHELLLSYREIFRERYILPISHDEVVHEKKSMIEKMPLDRDKKFAHLRLYYSAAICHPGKNLFFMGTEIAEETEWDCKGELDWQKLRDPMHLRLKRFVREMNHFYLKHSALWEIDFDQKGFMWIDFSNTDYSIISFLRKGIKETLACVHNFTPTTHKDYHLPLPGILSIEEIFNTDDVRFGGEHLVNVSVQIAEKGQGAFINVPPLTTLIFRVELDS